MFYITDSRSKLIFVSLPRSSSIFQLFEKQYLLNNHNRQDYIHIQMD